MGLNLRLPDRVFVHGLLDLNGEKMSKSRGNVINPVDLINRYGVDTVRWYLAREMTFGSDGKFTPELFVERINMDLANNYGNLINRTSSMIIKYFGGVVPELTAPLSEFDKKMKSLQDATVKLYESSMDDLKLTEGLACVMEYLNGANKYIEETTPWVLAKENRIDELKNVMCVLANAIVCASIMLKPALVESFDKVMKQFNVPEQLQNYENNVYSFCPLSGVQVTKESPLFPRLDKAIEVEFISSLSNKK